MGKNTFIQLIYIVAVVLLFIKLRFEYALIITVILTLCIIGYKIFDKRRK